MAEESEMVGFVAGDLKPEGETGNLVELNFQKNPSQAKKYLEAEPKALGVTQIMLSLFFLCAIYLNWNFHYFYTPAIISASFSSPSIIAGSVAIAAQNLHLPTLKACLGMQVVACVFSVFCFLISWGLMLDNSMAHFCYEEYHNGTRCERLLSIYEHISGIEMLVQATQIALSATLAAFCCKVIQCCSPKNNVPVIVVNTPPGPQ
ncbi:hypothetical protein Q7C36_004748 [Tachysurus vachellii]|uniref:Membrane-spanning 4-domains subfamily A member 4A-like n=1 Tax=Tachysurus vachellii TaxID=175792 RepID=A0AA88T4C5_TACVA|nr:uncharacterized protein LOC132848527 [Tachysurus vachellii]KAK2860582.1 hypothetical protein Q7C36_004748 [Tachysurus vachellii]